jgi:hypothetical protein
MMTAPSGRPRLYFDSTELSRLRARGTAGHHAAILRNMITDAECCAAMDASAEWIAPADPDPRYENLYDRFWAIMSDAAIVEQLAFTAAYSGEARLAALARARLLAACDRWRQETILAPDYGTSYATTRMLKALAIGYDVLYAGLGQGQRATVRLVLTASAARLAADWFSRPDVSGPVGVEPGLHSPHHSSVEWSAFGIAGLSLLGEVPDAAEWVAATARHFAAHLLPSALSPDGTHPEGNDFWASTLSSQLQFLDPLRRILGQDLLTGAARSANTAVALAMYRPYRELSTRGEPLYGESTAVSAVLFGLARELRDPVLQRLAMEEPTTGRLEVGPTQTLRRGERFRIAPGGYAYAWYDPELAAASLPGGGTWAFPGAQEAYLRSGWDREDALAAVRAGKISVYVGARTVFEDLTPARLVDLQASREAGTGIYTFNPPDLACRLDGVGKEGAGQNGILWAQCRDDAGAVVARIELDPERHALVIDRTDGHPRTCAYDPGSAATLEVIRGHIEATTRRGYKQPDLRPGYDLLDVRETDALWYDTMAVSPAGGRISLSIGFGREMANAEGTLSGYHKRQFGGLLRAGSPR